MLSTAALAVSRSVPSLTHPSGTHAKISVSSFESAARTPDNLYRTHFALMRITGIFRAR